MSVAAASPTTVGAARGSTQAGRATEPVLDPNMFMKLLVAEIRHQDPTKPMDSAQLVQQLAALSQVQNGTLTNSKLTTLLETMSVGQSAALVGRSLTSSTGEDLGPVEAVRLTAQGLVARVAGGREVALGEGITIRT